MNLPKLNEMFVIKEGPFQKNVWTVGEKLDPEKEEIVTAAVAKFTDEVGDASDPIPSDIRARLTDLIKMVIKAIDKINNDSNDRRQWDEAE